MIIFSERAQAYRAGAFPQDSVTPLTTESRGQQEIKPFTNGREYEMI